MPLPLTLRLHIATFTLMTSLSSGVAAQTYSESGTKTISKVGVQESGIYLTVAEPLTQNCLYSVLYVAADRRSLYALLLGAKLNGKRLSRIDYSQPGGAGTECNLDLVEVTE